MIQILSLFPFFFFYQILQLYILHNLLHYHNLLHTKRVINSGTTNVNYNDLVSCLLNLGYHQNLSEKTALEVIRKNKNSTLEKLIPIALNHLSQPNK